MTVHGYYPKNYGLEVTIVDSDEFYKEVAGAMCITI